MGLRHFLLSSQEIQYFSSSFVCYNCYLFKFVGGNAFLNLRCIHAMPVVRRHQLDVRCIKSFTSEIELIICSKSFLPLVFAVSMTLHSKSARGSFMSSLLLHSSSRPNLSKSFWVHPQNMLRFWIIIISPLFLEYP